MGYIYIALTLLFTVYGQLILKWQIAKAGSLPTNLTGKIGFLFSQFTNPWILSGFVAAFLASLTWMAAMTRFDLSHAYPFMSLAFVIVLIFSIAFLGEPITWTKVAGTVIVIAGLIVITR